MTSPKKGFGIYSGGNLLQIAMPMGGIGSGSVCLNGYGGLQDFAIRHKPFTSAVPDQHFPQDCAFALLHLPNQRITRLVEGPMPVEKIYNQGLKSNGYIAGGYEGLPRFHDCSFQGEYPFGTVTLSDDKLPLSVTITGFNPLIPLDDRNSSIPCAILEYTFHNQSTQVVPFEFSFHLSHLAFGEKTKMAAPTRNVPIPGIGAFLYNLEDPNSEAYGSAALGVVGYQPQIKAMWFRGAWFDAVSSIWREVSTGTFQPNQGNQTESIPGRNGASILLQGSLAAGESITYPIVFTWFFPNVNERSGKPPAGAEGNPAQDCCDGKVPPPAWRPYYASQWVDARDVLEYVVEGYSQLRQRTQAFHDALYSSSLPGVLLEEIGNNLAILKSPTILRQENGNLWGWEGCFSEKGCCPGSCTHVWNYAQSIPHLYPVLERTLREQELYRSLSENGHATFRAALPDGPISHDFHAAADGQLGGIMKIYREWQISGDLEWAKSVYPFVKRSLDYCIETWDPRHIGLLEEPHHNTYDIEFWGADGMCSSFYLGALAAFIALARDTGHNEDIPFYADLASRGATAIDRELFNGQYYIQKVAYEGLRDTSFRDLIAKVTEQSSYEQKLLKKEGPKYQYGTGCLSDGVLGAWMAKMCYVETPQNHENINSHLKSVYQNNFKLSLWEHANPQRPGYAIGDEPGLILTSWPLGGKPTLPFPYSDEVWTGIEHQVASHMIGEGMLVEGIAIEEGVRKRYDGRARNPFNEYECGSYYARAMSSYGLLIAYSGFEYSAVSKTLRLNPKGNQPTFKTFFSTASGWGTIKLTPKQLTIEVTEGNLEIQTVFLPINENMRRLDLGMRVEAGQRKIIKI